MKNGCGKSSRPWDPRSTIRMFTTMSLRPWASGFRSGISLSLICRKLAKNKSTRIIAEELEEDDIEYIQHICEVAEKYAPDYDADRIYGELYPESDTE